MSVLGLVRRVRAKLSREYRIQVSGWDTAQSVAELCELTARWLEGGILEHPGYYGRPDPETTDLVPVLAMANRAGFLTINSQPGYLGAGIEARAFVDGLCDVATAERLFAACDASIPPLRYEVTQPAGWSRVRPGFREVPVSRHTGGPYFTAIGPWHERDSRATYGGVPAATYKQLRSLWYIVLFDPYWGPTDTLWNTLSTALRSTQSNEQADPA